MPCFCESVMQRQMTEGFSDDLASYIAGDIVEAASSTTSDELSGFLVAMVTYSDVQRRAQREINSVVGPNRLPQLKDMALLPYVRGCVKKTLRWMLTTALLVPHLPLKDDIYHDYIILAGASVVLNVWALNMDPATWPNPHVFDPLRFIDETRSEHQIATSSDTTFPRHNYVFGAGRRSSLIRLQNNESGCLKGWPLASPGKKKRKRVIVRVVYQIEALGLAGGATNVSRIP